MREGILTKLDRSIAGLDAALRDVTRERHLDRLRAEYEDPEFRANLEAHRAPLRSAFSFAAVARGIPEMAEAFQTKVPSNFWSMMEGRLDVLCPCKAIPHPGIFPEPCPGEECPRWYVYDGRDVRVAFSPRGGAPVPQDDEEPLIG